MYAFPRSHNKIRTNLNEKHIIQAQKFSSRSAFTHRTHPVNLRKNIASQRIALTQPRNGLTDWRVSHRSNSRIWFGYCDHQSPATMRGERVYVREYVRLVFHVICAPRSNVSCARARFFSRNAADRLCVYVCWSVFSGPRRRTANISIPPRMHTHGYRIASASQLSPYPKTT